MFRKLCAEAASCKNVLMLITAGVYIIALYSTLSERIFALSLIITIIAAYLLIKELFPPRFILVWILVFYFGVINTSARLRDVDELLSLAPVNSQITGEIISIPQGKNDGKPSFFFNVKNIEFGSVKKEFNAEKVLVTVNKQPDKPIDFSLLKPYNSYILTGRLSTPFKAGNPSQFDYGNYLRNHNTYAVFYANNVKVLSTKLSFKAKFMQWMNSYRENVINIHSKYLPSPNLEILGGIVFGDDAVSPPKEIKKSFVNSGLLHILAASGMNVAFIYGFFFMIMSWLRINFKVRVALGMVTVLIYSLMTGLGASVIRATCMLLFVLAGKLIDRDSHSISLLSFVALLMLVYNPLWVNDVGFQLSFVVTFGILIMAPVFVRTKNKIEDFLSSTVAIPIIAQIWVIPIQIFYFNNISIYSIFANIMSVPILMVLSFGGFVSSLLSAITPIADIVCRCFDIVLNPLLTLLVNISDFWGKLPNSSVQTTHPSVFQLIIYYGIVLCLSGLLYKDIREKYAKKLIISTIVLIITIALSLISINTKALEITAFDVGNADSFLIKTPKNEYIMIDTGKAGYQGGKSQAEIIILKYLKDIGVKHIDSVIVTHFDNDHCGGAVDVMNIKNGVSKLYVNDLKHNSQAARDIYKTAAKTKVEIIQAENKQTVYDFDGIKLINYIYHSDKSDNENSIVTLLSYNDFSMLFTGDAGISSLKNILDELPKNITVLKVPHHGAIGGINKEIVNYLNPKYALISTGENKFGHPSLYTLELLKGTKILRTDVDNSIRFVVNNKDYRLYTYDIKSRKYQPTDR